MARAHFWDNSIIEDREVGERFGRGPVTVSVESSPGRGSPSPGALQKICDDLDRQDQTKKRGREIQRKKSDEFLNNKSPEYVAPSP